MGNSLNKQLHFSFLLALPHQPTCIQFCCWLLGTYWLHFDGKTHKIESIICLDVQKAFDSVEMDCLKKLLHWMGFGEQFMNAIYDLYEYPKAQLHINHITSQQLRLEQGTRQGCPMSPLLFALATEPLAKIFRSHPRITAFQINGGEHRVSLYADDLVVYLTNLQETLPELHNILREFGLIIGLVINQSKSNLFPIYLKDETIAGMQKYT